MQPKSTPRLVKFLLFLKNQNPAFKNALAGLGYVIASQRNAWIHAAATVAVLVLGLIFQLPPRDWAFLLLAIGLVWTTEIINTAIEVLVNLVSPQFNPLAKIIKDVSAAAVLIAALISIIIGLLLFIPPLIQGLK